MRSKALELVNFASGALNGIAVWHPDFHTGVIGIVAQRLVEHYYRPAAVMGKGPDDTFKGSVRGVRGMSVVELLSRLSPYLLSYGGHEGAGGFSIHQDKLKSFCQAFDEVCGTLVSDEDRIPVVVGDAEVHLDELSINLVEQFESLSPFGVGNPAPVLFTPNLRVVETRELRGGHLKAILTDGSRSITGMLWRTASHPALTRGAFVDVAYKLDVNSYLGERTLQATIQAVAGVPASTAVANE